MSDDHAKRGTDPERLGLGAYPDAEVRRFLERSGDVERVPASRCDACSSIVVPPRSVCPRCRGLTTPHQDVESEGMLYTHAGRSPVPTGIGPYAALVRLNKADTAVLGWFWPARDMDVWTGTTCHAIPLADHDDPSLGYVPERVSKEPRTVPRRPEAAADPEDLAAHADEARRRFSEALIRSRTLLVGVCGRCGARSMPPSSICGECFAPVSEWRSLDGTGSVTRYTICQLPEDRPRVIAWIELEEGVGLLGEVRTEHPEDLDAAPRVRPVWSESPRGTLADILHFEQFVE